MGFFVLSFLKIREILTSFPVHLDQIRILGKSNLAELQKREVSSSANEGIFFFFQISG